MNGCPNCGNSVKHITKNVIWCAYCNWRMEDGVVVNNGSKRMAQ